MAINAYFAEIDDIIGTAFHEITHALDNDGFGNMIQMDTPEGLLDAARGPSWYHQEEERYRTDEEMLEISTMRRLLVTWQGLWEYEVEGMNLWQSGNALRNAVFAPSGAGETAITVTASKDGQQEVLAQLNASGNDGGNLFQELAADDADRDDKEFGHVVTIALSNPEAGTIENGGFIETASNSGVYVSNGTWLDHEGNRKPNIAYRDNIGIPELKIDYGDAIYCGDIVYNDQTFKVYLYNKPLYKQEEHGTPDRPWNVQDEEPEFTSRNYAVAMNYTIDAGTHYEIRINASHYGYPHYSFILALLTASLRRKGENYALRPHEYLAYISQNAATIGHTAELIYHSTPDEHGRVQLPAGAQDADVEDEYWQFEPGESNLDALKRYLQTILDYLSDRNAVYQDMRYNKHYITPPGLDDRAMYDFSTNDRFWTFFRQKIQVMVNRILDHYDPARRRWMHDPIPV